MAGDVFLAFHRNEACPNVVLEAMACGLPILYVESGATPELVGAGGLPVTKDNFREQLDRLLGQQDVFSASARERAEMAFNPEFVFALYERWMETALKRHLGWSGVSRWLWAWSAKLGRPVRDRIFKR